MLLAKLSCSCWRGQIFDLLLFSPWKFPSLTECRDREHPSCSGETTYKYVHVASLQGSSICCRGDDMTASEWNPTAPRFKSAVVLEASTGAAEMLLPLSVHMCRHDHTRGFGSQKADWRRQVDACLLMRCWDISGKMRKPQTGWGETFKALHHSLTDFTVRLWSLTWTFYSEDVLPCLLFSSAIFVTALIFNSDAPIDRPGTRIRRFPVFSTGRSVSHVSNHKIVGPFHADAHSGAGNSSGTLLTAAYWDVISVEAESYLTCEHKLFKFVNLLHMLLFIQVKLFFI